MSWLNTSNAAEAEQNSSEFWRKLKSDIDSGTFWADKIKSLKSEPEKRLALALENLPLPGAFREAAIALRGIIREKKKKKEDFEKDLSLMYWLIAIESFSIPYSDYLQQPGFNVIESMPGAAIQSLPFSYEKLGYTKLKLASKTDAKWFVEAWGEPVQHTTLNQLHNDVWKRYERETKIKQEQQLAQLLSGL
ncbi:hypothetical protein [Pseudohongiella spirulinae]|uniref:Uncharacterized protein n=1 Tax=Pseudohongiella spirulinae TaxID=1249552 RepID=A0A0S2K9A4_9GAMM|nr:hypothetical protein [Pseudohongiella spirulinae]ALO44923.1 hypothetical protein PS2015_230 [Pseudohongiella spirulinae]